ncbi:helix-turn-helix domain-containing protein [Stutzerimonas nitrititolerans]|uniref:helix-turn-helix domain-containing protein n=1 Tax=Stutzerimonas nitrititolerans TaxID=2482751 RepID=UPI00289D3DB5|nr:helix-turn-helix domain-containing protein [Stutzerimonas nitrititolerans]
MGKYLPIVKVCMDRKLPIGERLKEERERLGENQTDFAALAGVTRKTLFGYETAERMPPADALAAWAESGLDVAYVVLGQRSNAKSISHLPRGGLNSNPPTSTGLTADELELLELFRSATLSQKMEAVAVLTGSNKKKASRPKPAESAGVTVRGSGNRTAGRDYHEKE